MPPTASTYRPSRDRHAARARRRRGLAASANRRASTPFGMTVAVMPQPSRSSPATAADTQTWRDAASTMARSWQAASSGVVKWSMWCTVRTQRSAALALMQSCACTMS